MHLLALIIHIKHITLTRLNACILLMRAFMCCLLCFLPYVLSAQALNPTTTQSSPTDAASIPNVAHMPLAPSYPPLESSQILSNLLHNSSPIHRYNIRLTHSNRINMQGLYANSIAYTQHTRYVGGLVLYDKILDRQPLGAFLSYLSAINSFSSTHVLALGIFSDMFLQSHHLRIVAAQGFYTTKSPLQASLASSQALASTHSAYATSSNASLSYGRVLTINQRNSLEPYIRYNLYALFPINTQASLTDTLFHNSIDIGMIYRYVKHQWLFMLSPSLRQHVFIMGEDTFARPMPLSPMASGFTTMPNNQYHTFIMLDMGLEWRASSSYAFILRAHSSYTERAVAYGGWVYANVLF